MKTVGFVMSAALLFTISGCSANSQKSASNGAQAVAQASVAPDITSPVAPAPALAPAPAVSVTNQQAWRSEKIKDSVGNTLSFEKTSSDGKFDLVVLQKGTFTSISFVRHTKWESVYNRPAKGKLMSLRIKFDDAPEERIEWDELGVDSGKLRSIVWSYPASADMPIGPMPKGTTLDSPDGDERLLQSMLKHKSMLVEVEPGTTTQFELAGLAHEIQNSRPAKTPQVLKASQTAE